MTRTPAPAGTTSAELGHGDDGLDAVTLDHDRLVGEERRPVTGSTRRAALTRADQAGGPWLPRRRAGRATIPVRGAHRRGKGRGQGRGA